MRLRLAPHLFATIIGDRTVVLDVDADRYRLLGHGMTEAIRNWAKGDAIGPAISALHKIGMRDGVSPTPLTGPPRIATSAMEIRPSEQATLSLSAVAFSLAWSMIRLRTRGLGCELQDASTRALPDGRATGSPVPLAWAYVRYRTGLPVRNICLPDSLAMHRLACTRGFKTSLVIGVRLDPFAAHCWVQAGDVVLNDSCDNVAGFAPILVL